jgi:Ankyrin repeats (3 copies)
LLQQKMQTLQKSPKTFNNLPVDILLVIVTNLTLADYRNLRFCSKQFALLNPVPQIKLEGFVCSCKSQRSVRDPSKTVRLSYSSLSTNSRIQQAFMFIVSNNLETEFFRFIQSPLFSLVDSTTKGQAISRCFAPLSYSFRSLPICFSIILNPSINLVLNEKELSFHLNESLILACQSSETTPETIKSLLDNPLTTPTYKENAALLKASKSGCLSTIQLLLKALDSIPPKVFYWPCIDDRVEIIKALLDDGRPDPGFYNTQTPIKLAAKYGNTRTVKVLLGDPRVDPSIDYNSVLRETAIKGHLEVMELLLRHEMVIG